MTRLTVETVAGRRVAGFDHASVEYKEHWAEMAADLHASGPPIVWVDSDDGGFWLLGSWSEIHRVASDWETFTSENDLEGTGNGGRGQRVPQMPYRLFLGESDPPLHSGRRALEAPFFAPKSLRKWRPVAQHYLHDAIDQIIEHDHCDLINDILIPTTARTTLYVLGYDADDYRDAADVAHRMSFMKPDDPNYPYDEADRMRARFREALVDRRQHPKADILSSLANGLVMNEPLQMHEAESMVNALVFGGFDTTTSVTAHSLRFMDQNPDQAARFRDDPSVRRNFVEELLRLNPPTGHMVRTAVRPAELLGQAIQPGERIYMWFSAGSRDPLVFDQPDTFDPDRANARDHLSFSAGHHRCLGSPLAKIEIEEMLTTIPDRLEGLRIDHDRTQRYPSIRSVNGFIDLPATFTPGERVHGIHPDSAFNADRS
jgi:cytochrome P450